MKEFTKIYNVRLYRDAIEGIYNKLLQHGNFELITNKVNDNNYSMTLYKNGYKLFEVVNTIDCLYSMLDGYQRALYDNNIIK